MANKEEKLWNSNYIKVMTANFAMFFAFYIMTPLLPLYLSEHFHATKDVIGIVLSGYTVAALLFRPFSGYIVDSFNRKKTLMLFFILYFVFFSGYLLAGSLLVFAVIRTLHGAPFGASTVANSTVAIDVLPSSRRNEGIGYYGLSNNIATAIAPTAGVFVYKYWNNFNILFIIALLFASVSVIVSSTVTIQEKQVVKNKKKISFDRFFLTKGWLLGVNMIFFSLCYGVISNYLAIYSKQELNLTGNTGVFFMLLSAGLILSRLQGNKSLKQGKLTHNAGIGILVSTAGYAVFVLSSGQYGMYLSALLIGLGNGHMYPAFQNMIINTAFHSERGTANSTLLTCWDVGVGIGIVAGGVIAEHVSYHAAFWTVVFVHVLGAAVFFAFTRKFFLRRRIA
ncbi:MAG: MFS transporter [Bacteroidales bacterium]|nr:MFS transporter [Bacteroidales bacterium]MBP3254720.1 MFS transporter [Bacteroidales bacterium]